MILLTKKKIYKNRQKGKVTNIAEIKYELSVQLQYEQYNVKIEGKLPTFEPKWSDLIHILTKCRVYHLRYLSLNP